MAISHVIECLHGPLNIGSCGRRITSLHGAPCDDPEPRYAFRSGARHLNERRTKRRTTLVAGNLSVQQRGNGGSASQLSQRRSGGGLFTDLLGFDPFRHVFPVLANAPNAFGLNVIRTDDGYTVEVPVAGFRPDQIDVTVQEDTVVVSGKGDRRNFTRALVLPDEIDPDGISATVDHGLLTLRLGRRPETQPRRIPVGSGTSSGTETLSGSAVNPSSADGGKP